MKQPISLVFVATIIILLAALSRVALYPTNFSPMIAMALFGGAVIKDKKFAFAFPLLAMFLSDLLFEVLNIANGFWGWGQLIGYGIFAAITIFGFTLKKINVLNVAGYSIASSLIFFLLSNSSVWIFDKSYYAKSFSGLMDCIAAGIPFLKNGLAADLFYSVLFFGGYLLMKKYVINKAIA